MVSSPYVSPRRSSTRVVLGVAGLVPSALVGLAAAAAAAAAAASESGAPFPIGVVAQAANQEDAHPGVGDHAEDYPQVHRVFHHKGPQNLAHRHRASGRFLVWERKKGGVDVLNCSIMSEKKKKKEAHGRTTTMLNARLKQFPSEESAWDHTHLLRCLFARQSSKCQTSTSLFNLAPAAALGR